jgi:SAM-dependent methyltransferase
VECAGYAADLDVWRELAERTGGPGVLDLGAGTGRVALDLAARGHAVTALDADPDLMRALAARARARGLIVATVVADARSFALGRRFGLVVLPMQVVQLLGGPDGRRAMLRRGLAHLEPGGLLAAALADPWEGIDPEHALPPLPDMGEADGWVVSSAPVAVRAAPGAVLIDRVRQAVSPRGDLFEALTTIRLDALTRQELEDEAAALGYRVRAARHVPETEAYVGSTVVVLEAPG